MTPRLGTCSALDTVPRLQQPTLLDPRGIRRTHAYWQNQPGCCLVLLFEPKKKCDVLGFCFHSGVAPLRCCLFLSSFCVEGERNLFFFFNKKRERNTLTTEAQPQESTERRRSKKHKKGTSSLLRFAFFTFGIHQQDSFPQTVLASLCCFCFKKERERRVCSKVYNKLSLSSLFSNKL